MDTSPDPMPDPDRASDELEALVDTLLAAAPAGVACIDCGGRMVRVNETLAGLTGRAPAEHIGRTIADIFPALASTLDPELRRVLDSGVAGRNIDVSFPTADRSPLPRFWQARCLPVTGRSGGRVGALLIVLDTTEQRRTEELRGFYLQASDVLGSSLDYQTTLDTVARMAVPRFADFCTVDIVEGGVIRRLAVAGRDPETEALVSEMRERYPFDPDEGHGVPWVIRTGQPELTSEISEHDLAQHAVDEGHLAMLRRLGMTSVLRVPLVAGNRAFGAMSLGATQSGRRYDAAMVVLVQILGRRAALAMENARLYREAQEGLRIREEFMTAVSHDLRTPLTPIKGFIQILMRRAQRMSPPDRDALLEGLATIEANVSKMQSLIGQLLDVAQMERGRSLDLEQRATDLVAVVTRSITLHTHGQLDVQVRVDAPGAPVIGLWDPDRIERVVSNLLLNAIKYSPLGADITVRIATEAGESGSAIWAVLAVQDCGIGIPAADLPHVLEPFYRAANVGTAPGTGIGLAGVKQIVEQHGGTIAVESSEGRGTTVTVRLPLAPPA